MASPISEKHVFAFIWPEADQPLDALKKNQELTIRNPDLCHRIISIVRLTVHDELIIFDRATHITVSISAISKKQITTIIHSTTKNTVHQPEIICALPLLKREALETALDSLTQMGATTIQLITTQKTHRSNATSKDMERLQRVIWSAAEQSKNFHFPLLLSPLDLSAFISMLDPEKSLRIFLDPHGKKALEVVHTIQKIPYSSLLVIVGPEGDLTNQEKKLLQDHQVTNMALTPTILRAEQAAALAVGMLRSFIH